MALVTPPTTTDETAQLGHAVAGGPNLNRLGVSATMHCMTGCVIGEVLGLAIGTALGWSDLGTIAGSRHHPPEIQRLVFVAIDERPPVPAASAVGRKSVRSPPYGPSTGR